MNPARLAWSVLFVALGATAACGWGEPPTVPLPPAGTAAASPPPPPPRAVKVAVAVSVPAPERDGRFKSRPLRSPALLLTELQGLETLREKTPLASSDLPKLLRRLADTYAELAQAAERDRAAAPPDAPEAAKAGDLARVARAATVKYYARLAHDHPTWCGVTDPVDPLKRADCADATLYYLALELERADYLDSARQSYLDVIRGWPDSRYVPLAYLAFGEMFMKEAETDPSKLRLAEEAYQKVLQFPPPDNRAFDYARRRLEAVVALQGGRKDP